MTVWYNVPILYSHWCLHRVACADYGGVMDPHLLTTRLFVPLARPGPAPRARFMERLRPALKSPITQTCARARFGTTALSTQRVVGHRPQLSSACLQVDNGDEDHIGSCGYFAADQGLRYGLRATMRSAMPNSSSPCRVGNAGVPQSCTGYRSRVPTGCLHIRPQIRSDSGGYMRVLLVLEFTGKEVIRQSENRRSCQMRHPFMKEED
jgi:hypothetical protein